MKFQLNDRVYSTKTGHGIIGNVVSVWNADAYVEMLQYSKVFAGTTYWDTLFPGWKDKCVYIVHIPGGTRAMRIEEVMSQVFPQKERMDAEVLSWYENQQYRNYLVFAEDDLEPVL